MGMGSKKKSDAPKATETDPSADLTAQAPENGAAELPGPVDASLEGEEQKLAADAAEFDIQLAGEPADPIQAERLKLELRLDELGDPLARRRELAKKIEDEIEDHKHEEKAHAKRLGALRYELQLEADRGQDELEEIRLANIRLDQLKVLAEQKAALEAQSSAEAARMAATAPARIAGDSA